MHADPVDGTRAMREKRLDLLKESQIRSWLSSYQQKRKRENERLAADLWQLQGQLTFSSWASTAASVKGNNLPTTAPATTITPCTSATTQNGNILSSIKTDAIFNSSYPSITSGAVTLIPTQRPFTSVSTLDSTEPSVTSAATLDSTQPSVTSVATVNASWPTTALQVDLLGANVGNGVVFLLEHITVNHWQPKQK